MQTDKNGKSLIMNLLHPMFAFGSAEKAFFCHHMAQTWGDFRRKQALKRKICGMGRPFHGMDRKIHGMDASCGAVVGAKSL